MTESSSAFTLLTFLCSCRLDGEEHSLLHTEHTSFLFGSPETETKRHHDLNENLKRRYSISDSVFLGVSLLLPSSVLHPGTGALAPQRGNRGRVDDHPLRTHINAISRKYKTSQSASTESKQTGKMGSGFRKSVPSLCVLCNCEGSPSSRTTAPPKP